LKSRRSFLKTIASVGLSAVARPAFAIGADRDLLGVAKAGLERAGARIEHRDLVGVADFSEASRAPRLHLVDLANGRLDSLLVAHGRGSDPDHTGWLSRFSNAPGSAATSEGSYLTGSYYDGHHGRSMRLAGLDPSNSNAEAREIVVHSAWYVGPEILRQHGMLGRSEGCFAVSPPDLSQVLARLGPGRLLIAVKL
jgi:hypothetical protein